MVNRILKMKKKKKIINKEKTIRKLLKPMPKVSSLCEICGEREYEHLHHIDFDKETGKSNKDSETQKLCTLCHAKVHGMEPKRSELKDKCVLLNRNQKTRIVIDNQIRGFGRIEMKIPDYYLGMKEVLVMEEKKLVKEINNILEGKGDHFLSAKTLYESVSTNIKKKKGDHSDGAKTQILDVSFPIYSWLKSIKGMGPLNSAYLIGYIDWKKTPSVSALWCYCGQTPDSKRTKGKKSNWNPVLKQRCFMISEGFIKSKSPYKKIYDKEKAKQLKLMENDQSKIAKTQSKDVTPSIPKSRMHAHKRGMRKMVKTFLKDLWVEQNNIQKKETHIKLLKPIILLSPSNDNQKKKNNIQKKEIRTDMLKPTNFMSPSNDNKKRKIIFKRRRPFMMC